MEALRQKNEKPMDAINSSKLPSKMNMRRLFAKKKRGESHGIWHIEVFMERNGIL